MTYTHLGKYLGNNRAELYAHGSSSPPTSEVIVNILNSNNESTIGKWILIVEIDYEYYIIENTWS